MKFLRLKEVEKKVGWKKTKIYAMIKESAFPAPKKFNRSSCWLSSEIEEWIKNHTQIC